jgi:hypothetical protein
MLFKMALTWLAMLACLEMMLSMVSLARLARLSAISLKHMYKHHSVFQGVWIRRRHQSEWHRQQSEWPHHLETVVPLKSTRLSINTPTCP